MNEAMLNMGIRILWWNDRIPNPNLQEIGSIFNERMKTTEHTFEERICEHCGSTHDVEDYEFIYTFRGKPIVGPLCTNCRLEQAKKEEKLTRKTGN